MRWPRAEPNAATHGRVLRLNGLRGVAFLAVYLKLPALRFLGAISYTMYLVHELALAWVGCFVPSRAGVAVASLFSWWGMPACPGS